MQDNTYNPEELKGKWNTDFFNQIENILLSQPTPKELLFFGTEKELKSFIKTVKRNHKK